MILGKVISPRAVNALVLSRLLRKEMDAIGFEDPALTEQLSAFEESLVPPIVKSTRSES